MLSVKLTLTLDEWENETLCAAFKVAKNSIVECAQEAKATNDQKTLATLKKRYDTIQGIIAKLTEAVENGEVIGEPEVKDPFQGIVFTHPGVEV